MTNLYKYYNPIALYRQGEKNLVALNAKKGKSKDFIKMEQAYFFMILIFHTML
ncbi:hypothetical protein [Treponema pectinovorum]|uniref:hypothetical protein n=1 Tax=Treponema pectinovorum TaxID=164 RepID=UPI003D8F9F06